MPLPDEFLNRLRDIVGEAYDEIEKTFSYTRPVSVRINTLKATREEVYAALTEAGIAYETVLAVPEAILVSPEIKERELFAALVRDGVVYQQGLSSMLPVTILDPQPAESILDTCAAPGSKTSQIAARMKNDGNIRALEVIRKRMFRLQAVLKILGVNNVQVTCCDARRFRPRDRYYDRILVDAPCSSEARFCNNDPASYAYWSPRKIKEMVRKQRGIILSASRLLRPGGVMLYATCSFAPEENEGIIDWFLRKTMDEFSVLPVETQSFPTYESCGVWGKKQYDARVTHCVRVKPTRQHEGFFMTLLQRN